MTFSFLFVLYIIQIEGATLRIYVNIRGPAESSGYGGEVFAFQIDRKFLPFSGQNHGTDARDVRVGIFAGNSADFKFFNSFAAFFAAGPESELLSAGQIVSAGTGSPIVRRVLPIDSGQTGPLRGFAVINDFYTGSATMGTGHKLLVQL